MLVPDTLEEPGLNRHPQSFLWREYSIRTSYSAKHLLFATGHSISVPSHSNLLHAWLPARSLSVSHPNVITTYRLCILVGKLCSSIEWVRAHVGAHAMLCPQCRCHRVHAVYSEQTTPCHAHQVPPQFACRTPVAPPAPPPQRLLPAPGEDASRQRSPKSPRVLLVPPANSRGASSSLTAGSRGRAELHASPFASTDRGLGGSLGGGASGSSGGGALGRHAGSRPASLAGSLAGSRPGSCSSSAGVVSPFAKHCSEGSEGEAGEANPNLNTGSASRPSSRSSAQNGSHFRFRAPPSLLASSTPDGLGPAGGTSSAARPPRPKPRAASSAASGLRRAESAPSGGEGLDLARSLSLQLPRISAGRSGASSASGGGDGSDIGGGPGSRASGGGSGSRGSGAAAQANSGQGRLQAILSGIEAVEVVSPSDTLAPGIYETWLISEMCDRWVGSF